MGQESLQSAGDSGRWRESDWNILLTYIEELRVVPIIGRDLLQVGRDGKVAPLEQYLAERLVDVLGLSGDVLPPRPTLNDVACHFLRDRNNQREDLYILLGQVLKEAALAPSKALCQLADIWHFNLFLTTSFTPLLEEAVRNKRSTVKPAAYWSHDLFEDLPPMKVGSFSDPIVYYLLGRPQGSRPYVISDEDLLEFVWELQLQPQPQNLFDALKENHLLLLGCSFSDWLARLFLRTARGGRLSESRGVEYLADSLVQSDAGLVVFLQRFSNHTKIFPGGGAAEFLEALHTRWQERNPRPTPPALPADAMPPGSVFISYVAEDLAAARNLYAGLTDAGLTAWFDKTNLGGGDRFNALIQKNIDSCACFIPVLSRNSESRRGGFFFKEWHWAEERSLTFPDDREFIIPIVVDDTQEIKRINFRDKPLNKVLTLEWLKGGRVTPEFINRMQHIVKGN
jgi:hypothetical protein